MYLASIPFFASRAALVLQFRQVRKDLRKVRPVDDLYTAQSRMLASARRCEPDEATDVINRRIYRDWEQVLSVVPAFPGVRRTVERLKEAGIKLGVMSDFPIGGKLEKLGLEDLWDAEVAAEEVGFLKPNPEPFRAVLDALEEAPEETLYVGNNYAYDVEGARAVGMRTAHLSLAPPADSKADFTFFRYARLAEWILDSQIRG